MSGNDTIANMVKNFKSEHNTLFTTPLKRPAPADVSEPATPEESLPLKRVKATADFDVTYVGSPREVRRIRADLIEARNTIKTLEARITNLHSVRRQMQLVFDEESKQLRTQLEYDRNTIEKLEMQLQEIRQREIDLKKELSNVTVKCEEIETKSEEKVLLLEKKINDIEENTKHQDLVENIEVRKLKRMLSEVMNEKKVAEEKCEEKEKLVEVLEKRLAEQLNSIKEFDLREVALQKAKTQIRELQSANASYLEYQERAKAQAHKLAHYNELEKEVIKLREENTRIKEEVKNKLILEEEVNDLKTRISKYKEGAKRLAELESMQLQNEMALNEWRAIGRGFCETSEGDATLPHRLRTAIEKIQQRELQLMSEKVEIESDLKNATYQIKMLKVDQEKLQKLVTDLRSTGDQKQLLISRMQKKLLLVSRERDSYRLQLDSYEKDLTMSHASNVGPHANQVQTLKERLEKLETINEGYKELLERYEHDLAQRDPGHVPTGQVTIDRLNEEIGVLKIENERLRERKDALEVQLEGIMPGLDSLEGGFVYHLKNNPLSECRQQQEQIIESLQNEVAKLKKKVKNLEEGLEASKMETDTISICPQEIQKLKDQIQSYESKMAKLKEYFKSSMQEFRDVIYVLLGYKIDRSGSSLYKLRSMYAESEEDMLCFQMNKDGDMNLLENEYSATLEDMINLHLRHQKSFPVFLSAITMDLFNNKTRTFTTANP